MKKILLGTLVGVTLGAVALGGTAIAYNKNEDFKTKVNTKLNVVSQAEHDSVVENNKTIVEELAEVKLTVESLTAQKTAIEQSFAEFKENHKGDYCSEDFESDNPQYAQLQQQYEQVQIELTNANNRVAELEQQLSQQNEYSVVTRDFERLTLLGLNGAFGFDIQNAEDSIIVINNGSYLKTLGEFNNIQYEEVRVYDIYDSTGSTVSGSMNNIACYSFAPEGSLTVNYVDQDGNTIQLTDLEDINYNVELIANDFEIKNDAIQSADITLKFTVVNNQ